MAAGETYTPIATQTLGSNIQTVTFSSISGSYTDLVLVANGAGTGYGFNGLLRFNGDTSTSNYFWNRLIGNGTSVGNDRSSTSGGINFLCYNNFQNVTNIQNYANANTYKTVLMRFNNPEHYQGMVTGHWAGAAITSVTILTPGGADYFPSGTTFTLYGITAA